jgi:putative nucleotidyltransferase with HDIG domain
MRQTPESALKAVDKMPAFPKSVQQVLQLTADINCSPKELVNVIKLDPIFTMKMLKVVNSPFVGLAQQVTSIQQASVFLGINTIKNLALSLATIGALPRTNKAGFNMNEFWLHSLAVAAIARRLAERIGVEKNRASDYFSAGLLHDIGKGVFALYLPETFKNALDRARDETMPLYLAEIECVGVSHAAIGATLA